MIVSDARREANRRNAARSTGPKTAEGKAASRRNAWKHGCTATTIADIAAEPGTPPVPPLLSEPESPWSWRTWLQEELVALTRRLDRVHGEERQLRDLVSLRAATTWDDDRRRSAEDIAVRLSNHPARTMAQLRATPAGCAWLIERWQILARRADQAAAGGGEGWSEDQRRLAFDLLGTPADARPERIGEVLDDQGRPTGVERTDAEVARAALLDLSLQRERVEQIDEVEQTLLIHGVTFDATAELRRLRRYETTLHNRLVWVASQLNQPGSPPSVPPPPLPDPTPRSRPDPEADFTSPSPEASPSPKAAFPQAQRLVATPIDQSNPRLEARLRRAEARQAQHQRKLDRRRA